MKFRFTVSGTYEVPKERMESDFGTTDPQEIAEIYVDCLRDEPWLFFESATDFKVEPDLQGMAEEGYEEVTNG